MNYNQFIGETIERRKDILDIDKFKFLAGKQSEISTKDRTIRSYITTEDPDRAKDIVRSAGLEIVNYKKNPVVLADHNASKPIGKNIQISIKQKDDGVYGVLALTEFAPTVFAMERFWLHKNGYLNAWSIAILCKEWVVMENEGWDIKKAELYEYSSVPIPANPEALDVEKLLISDGISREGKLSFLKQASISRYIELLEEDNAEAYKKIDNLKEIIQKIEHEKIISKSKGAGYAGAPLAIKDIEYIFGNIIKK